MPFARSAACEIIDQKTSRILRERFHGTACTTPNAPPPRPGGTLSPSTRMTHGPPGRMASSAARMSGMTAMKLTEFHLVAWGRCAHPDRGIAPAPNGRRAQRDAPPPLPLLRDLPLPARGLPPAPSGRPMERRRKTERREAHTERNDHPKASTNRGRRAAKATPQVRGGAQCAAGQKATPAAHRGMPPARRSGEQKAQSADRPSKASAKCTP